MCIHLDTIPRRDGWTEGRTDKKIYITISRCACWGMLTRDTKWQSAIARDCRSTSFCLLTRFGGRYSYDSTSIRLQFDCTSTALRPFDDLRYDRRPTCRVATIFPTRAFTRVEFKTCVLVYNCLHNISPSYLSSMCQPVSVNPSRRCLRSAARGDLVVPATKQSATALVALPSQDQDQLRGTRCRHHSAMTNCLSLYFAVYSRLNFLPEHTTLL